MLLNTVDQISLELFSQLSDKWTVFLEAEAATSMKQQAAPLSSETFSTLM